ncbi:MAG TPA: MalY/PatB family protein [Synergistales bacterium]|nr:MalY/PatB family protein [Synergistales bacterium]
MAGRYDFDTVIDRSNTSCEKWDGLEERFGKPDLHAMWVADMDFKAPPELIDVLEHRVQHGIFGYTGRFDPYYRSVIDWVKRRHGWEIRKEWIAFSPGVVPALSMALLAFTQPGDKVVIQPPVYYPFFNVIGGRGRTILENPLIFENGRFSMDLDDLERKLDPSVKVIFLCSPHNPVGRVWARDELERLGRICVENDILIVSDEIHSDIIFSGSRHIPMASISEEIARRTLTCISPSKTFNIAGLSTSAVIIPDPGVRANYQRVVDFLHIDSGNVFGTLALEACYNLGEPWLEELLEYLEGNLDFTEDFLAKNLPGISLVRPEGTYIPLLDCRSLSMTGPELQKFLVDRARVALDGGDWFGTGGEGFARINIATPRSLLQEGLERISRAVKELG